MEQVDHSSTAVARSELELGSQIPDEGIHTYAKSRIGHDFSQLQVHADSRVSENTWLGSALVPDGQRGSLVAQTQQPLAGQITPLIQRQSERDEEDEEEPLQGRFATSETLAQLQGDGSEAANRTGIGMPGRLKAGLETLSGMDLSDVRVHYNSPKPAQLSALAYTQGQNIHVSPGQEKYLPHEGWHAVQQMQGRVIPKMQAKGEWINDDAGLEREADEMGAKALQMAAAMQCQAEPEEDQGDDEGSVQTKPLTTPLVQRQAAGRDADQEETDAWGEELAEHPLWDEVSTKFMTFFGEMATINNQFSTVTRGNWSEKWFELWSWVGGPGERADEELRALSDTFDQMKILFDRVNTEAYDLWADLINESRAELLELAGSRFPEDVAAREVLQEQFEKTNSRVDLAGAYLVPEDLLGLSSMLASGSHMAEGERVAMKEMKRQQKLDEIFQEEEGVESPSVASLVWDVVGWDSPGEFAADLALTAVTFGTGKFVRWVVKGRRAKKRLQRARKLRKALKARKAKRLRRLADGLDRLARNVKWVMENFEFVDNVEWVKQNWKKVALSYVTDEASEQLGGGDATRKKNILETAIKDKIGHYVETTTGATSELEKALFKNALFGFATGDSKWGRHKLGQYFRTNLKRRLLTNFVFAGLRVAVFETELSASTVSGVATSTAGNMADDLVDRVSGFGPVGQAIIETARKTLKTWVDGLIKSAFM